MFVSRKGSRPPRSRIGYTAFLAVVLLSFVGCVAAPPPPPTPTPMPAGPRPATREDMVGWWKTVSDGQTFRFEPNGAYRWLFYDFHVGVCGVHCEIPAMGGYVEARGDAWGFADSVGWLMCPRDQVGIYRIALAAEGKLEYAVLEDPCTTMWGTRRAVSLAEGLAPVALFGAITGTWLPRSEGGPTLQFREDLSYRLLSGEMPPGGGTMRGFVDVASEQLLVHDMSACPAPMVGRYRVQSDDDGRLSLEAEEDPCDERRIALTENGPWTRDPLVEPNGSLVT